MDDDQQEYFLLTNLRDQVNEEAVSGETGEYHHEGGEVSDHADGYCTVS